MRMTPIVAVVDAPTLAAVQELAASAPILTPELRTLMARNGWTDESLMAGVLIARAVSEATP